MFNAKTSIVVAISLGLGACLNPQTNAPPTRLKHSGTLPQTAKQQTGPLDFAQAKQELMERNPVLDAQTAIAQNQRMILCGAIRSRSYPGLDEAQSARSTQQCPLECLPGMSDSVLGGEHLNYLKAAYVYSAAWNQTMLSACQ